MDQNEEKLDYFTALNVDCTYEILERLPLSDLFTTSSTCTTLNALAGKYFHRKYPQLVSKPITIHELKDQIGLSTELYEERGAVKFFSRQFENIVLFQCKMDGRLSDFVKARFGEKLKRIAFNYCLWSDHNAPFGEAIQSNLKSVEVVQFHFIPNNISRLDNTLQYFSSIKYLKLTTHATQRSCIPIESYPTLKIVEYKFDDWTAVKFKCLAIFFHRNRQIKRFICNPNALNATKNVLAAIVSSSGIAELFLDLRNMDDRSCLRELKALDDCEHFEKLEIRVRDSNQLKSISGMLSPLKKLTGLHGLSSDDVAIVQSFSNLKVLSICNWNMAEEATVEFAKQLKCLEHLHFGFYIMTPTFKDLLQPFVRHSQHLYKVFVRIKAEGLNKDIFELNRERGKLIGACKMTIYLDKEYSNKSNISCELVEAKHVAVKFDTEVDRPNPLITYSFTEIRTDDQI